MITYERRNGIIRATGFDVHMHGSANGCNAVVSYGNRSHTLKTAPMIDGDSILLHRPDLIDLWTTFPDTVPAAFRSCMSTCPTAVIEDVTSFNPGKTVVQVNMRDFEPLAWSYADHTAVLIFDTTEKAVNALILAGGLDS